MLHASGIGTHLRGLFEAFGQMPEGEHPLLTLYGAVQDLKRYPYTASLPHVEFSAPIYGLRERFGYPAERQAPDFFHVPHYSVPERISRPFCVTIHDLIHILLPEVLRSRAKMTYARYLMKSAVRRSELIFTISECSRRDIVEHLGAKEEQIVIVPNAVSSTWKRADEEEVTDVKEAHLLNKPYLLAVGVNKPHKNFPWLIESYSTWKGALEVDLVICGVRSHNSEPLRSRVAELGMAARVHFIEYLDHHRLPALYQGAAALVFPSLYEGFGIPIIEANYLGLPVLSSNRASMTEVGGDAALYFDPESADALHEQLDKLFNSPDVASGLVERGYQNEKRFRWADAARITTEQYRLINEAIGKV